MSARATSDIVAALRIGPGVVPGGSTGATSEGVKPGSKRNPESCGCCAFERGCVGEVDPEPVAARRPVLSERVPFACALPRGANVGKSRTVECGE